MAQINDSVTITKIESGETQKTFVKGKLEHFEVGMYAVNYANGLLFSKIKDTIRIKNAQEPDMTICVFIKNNVQVRELRYLGKNIGSIESIIFDINNLPKNSTVSSEMSDKMIQSFSTKFAIDSLVSDESFNSKLDKSAKLFTRLEFRSALHDIDSVFNAMADFFSQEDALLKIFYGSYAEKFQKPTTAYLKTNSLGKIENGVFWNESVSDIGKYDIYRKGVIVETGVNTLEKFQETLENYFQKIANED